MSKLEIFLKILTWIAIFIGMFEMYLRINKCWNYKHIYSVVQSTSVIAALIGIANTVPFIAFWALKEQWEGFIGITVQLIYKIFLLLLGSGFWLRKVRKASLWTSIKQAMATEKKQVYMLADSFLKSQSHQEAFQILASTAMIDGHLHEKEFRIIKKLADHWNIPLTREAIEHATRQSTPIFTDMIRVFQNYLKTNPPLEQVMGLMDLMSKVIKSDGQISPEEDVLLKELRFISQSYMYDSVALMTRYEVNIATQSEEQEIRVRELLPDRPPVSAAGGYVYIVGTYFSEEYAEAVCEDYRKKGFLSFILKRKAQSDEQQAV